MQDFYISMIKDTSFYINNTSRTIRFYSELNSRGLLLYFCTFAGIKHRGLRVVGRISQCSNSRSYLRTLYSDSSGGFFRSSDMVAISNDLCMNYETFRKHVLKLVRLGWLHRTKTGYRLIGNRKLYDLYSPGLRRLSFFSGRKKDLIHLISYRYLKLNFNQQYYRSNNGVNCGTQRRHKYSRALRLMSSAYTVSVRNLSLVLGYKSAMTGSNVERRMESLGIIHINRSNIRLCNSVEYGNYLRFAPELTSRCFYSRGSIFIRGCNNIILNDVRL